VTVNSDPASVITQQNLPPLPALVVGKVEHTRHQPKPMHFNYRHYQWLVDLDRVPRWGKGWRWISTFRGEDHLAGNTGISELKENVLRCLERNQVEVDGSEQVVMLAHARSMGHVFDPMTAFFVFRPTSGALAGIVVEVHNTYNGRHAYVIQPDASGDAVIEKEFYVSPFNDAQGSYRMNVVLSPDCLKVCIELERKGQPLVTATVSGVPQLATRRSLTKVIATHPLMTHRVSLLIRRHGVALWLRGLPVRRRPVGAAEERNRQSVA
jgi:uncharacterized protein